MPDDAGAAGGPGRGGCARFWGGFAGAAGFGGAEESEVIDFFLGNILKVEVLKVMLMPKQAHAVQRTWFKAFVTIADYNGHVSLGVKWSKGVATANDGAVILVKLSIVPEHEATGETSASPTPSLAR
ncbi:40S ribosomal protein S2 [Myotis davidii]|uniref:40S ribosomal protein S2 n=1 Tax=Myotis davidii TaxID=225400 RepID=L5M048_MYODS|nr:40S ribosomal protein S2 [Myotis davidii]